MSAILLMPYITKLSSDQQIFQYYESIKSNDSPTEHPICKIEIHPSHKSLNAAQPDRDRCPMMHYFVTESVHFCH